jgi:Spy/CpxP family protein refolding chaperone
MAAAVLSGADKQAAGVVLPKRRKLVMRTLSVVLAVPVAVAVCACLGSADDKGQQGRAVVVVVERIQDLHLTDEQEARIGDIRKEYQPKVQEAGKELASVVKEEVEKVRAVLTPAQLEKLQALKEERTERRAECLAQTFAHLEQLDLTDGEIAKIVDIRKEYRPKIEAALKNLEGLLTAEQRKAREEGLKSGKKRREVVASLNLTADQKAKVETVCKEVATLVREEMEKIRDVLTAEQQAKLPEFEGERKERIRDRMAARIANFKELNLTDEQKTKIADIRKEYRPKVHEAGNKLRGFVRQEVEMIVAVMKA